MRRAHRLQVLDSAENKNSLIYVALIKPYIMLLLAAGIQVQYSASLDGSAGLPRWLTLLQSEDGWTSPAFIYGTPEEKDLGSVTLHVSVNYMVKAVGILIHCVCHSLQKVNAEVTKCMHY